MTRTLTISLCLILVVSTWGFAAEPAAVTIMTQNMDAGTDLTFAVGELMGAFPPGIGVELTYQEIQSSAIAERADMLAAKIADKKPDLLVLQEVTLWRTGDSLETATTVIADQLQLLLSSLTAKSVPYEIAALNTVSDLALPMYPSGALRMTDRDALLIRADLRPPAFQVADVHTNLFDAVYSVGPLRVPAGWISATIRAGGRHFRLFTTHLQGPVPGDPSAVAVQAAQAKQLLYEARNAPDPVVIAGDFNSDVCHGSAGRGPDNTDTAGLIRTQGYTDAWAAAGSGDGYTWPLYEQDQLPPPSFVARAVPYERIDLIFSKGLNVILGELVIARASHTTRGPSYGSDHAGVMASLQF